MEGKINAQTANMQKCIGLCEGVLNMPEPNITKSYLEGKSKLISELWVKIDATNDTLMETIDATEQLKIDYFIKKFYDTAFNMYDKTTVKLLAKLEKFKPAVQPQAQPLQLPPNVLLPNKSNTIKLKPIDITKFSGDYKKWISFRNMFDSLIHKDKELTKLQKMHYLKSCLEGTAERVISQFDIAEDSYDDAYTAITDRFHNEVILIDTHIMSILSQPNLTSESSDGIKELMDVTTENLLALKTLKVDTSTWDPILLLLLVQKLDQATRRLWEQNLKPKVRPTMAEFMDFLSSRFHALGCQQKFTFSIDSSSSSNYQNNKNRQYNSNNYKPQFQESSFPPRIHQSFHNSSQQSCPICSGENHSIFSCEKFRRANQRTRVEMVNYAKLCNRCLRKHRSDCTQREGCRVCGGNHHIFIHLDRQEDRNSLTTQNQQESQSKTQTEGENQSASVVNSHHVTLQHSAAIINFHHVKTVKINEVGDQIIPWDAPVLLATAIILIRSAKDDIFYPFRCLLDQGGEASHISQTAVQFLGLQEKPVSAAMVGLGGVNIGSSKSAVDFELGSKSNQNFTCKVQALVVSKVANPLPSSSIQKPDWKHIQGLRLADPEFYKPAKIDVILGTTVYGYLLLPGLKKGNPNSPVAQNTELGWILSGATEPDANVNTCNDDLKNKVHQKN